MADPKDEAKPTATPAPAPPKSPEVLVEPAPMADPVKTIAEAMQTAFLGVRSFVNYGKTEGMDTTIPGGKFLVEGRLVNANNREIDEDGKVLHPEHLTQDMFSGRMV